MRNTVIDMVGQTFGRLTIVARAANTVTGSARWLAQCSCGRTTVANGTQIRNGMTASCGCLRRDVTAATRKTHGHCVGRDRTPAYALWTSAKARAKSRGIEFTLQPSDIEVPKACPILDIEIRHDSVTVCDSSPSLDRINNERGYVPGNVWVISNRANRLKADSTPHELELIAAAVRSRLEGRHAV